VDNKPEKRNKGVRRFQPNRFQQQRQREQERRAEQEKDQRGQRKQQRKQQQQYQNYRENQRVGFPPCETLLRCTPEQQQGRGAEHTCDSSLGFGGVGSSFSEDILVD